MLPSSVAISVAVRGRRVLEAFIGHTIAGRSLGRSWLEEEPQEKASCTTDGPPTVYRIDVRVGTRNDDAGLIAPLARLLFVATPDGGLSLADPMGA